MSIQLRCARCTLMYDAPQVDGVVTISIDTLTLLHQTDGRSIIPVCPSCSVAMMQLAEPA